MIQRCREYCREKSRPNLVEESHRRLARAMGKMEDQQIIGSSVTKTMSLQYEVGQNYDAKCTFNPQGTIYNSKQRAEEFQDGDRTCRKVNKKETIYRDFYELAHCCLDT